MAERTWEGRGDKLTDARMSWISGRAADDLRLVHAHWRLLAHIGRQNHRRGWLRLSQLELSDAWDISRQTINKAIGELVEWGYLLKRDQKATGESFCTYKVRLDDDEEDEGGVSRPDDTPGHNAARVECKAGTTPPVSSPGDTSVKPRATRVSSPHDTPHYIPARAPTDADIRRTTPPRSPVPKAAPSVCATGGNPLDELRSDGMALHVVEHLLAPLLGVLAHQRRREPGAVPVSLLRGIRDACAEFSAAALSEAARAIRDERSEWPSVAQARRAAQTAQARTMVRIEPGTPQWAAWEAEWRRTAKLFLARTYLKQGYAMVTHEFPPASDPVKSTADKYITADGRTPGAAA